MDQGWKYYFFAISGFGEAAGAAATRTAVPVMRESDGLPKSRPTLMSRSSTLLSGFTTPTTYKAKKLRLELRDDGDGFKAKDRHDGVGLRGMRERVEQMGGELEITSSRGKGTKITVLLPCNGESIS
jgi:two-component sensor histidine kinase